MPDATSCSEYRRDSVQVINLSSLATWQAGRSRSWPADCRGDSTTTYSHVVSTVFLKRLDYMLLYVHGDMVAGLSVQRLPCVDGERTAGTRSSLSLLGPIGMKSLKGSRLGRWGETDMGCYLASPHIYHETATVNDGIR